MYSEKSESSEMISGACEAESRGVVRLPWHKPSVKYIDIGRTMAGGASAGDGGATSAP